MTQHSCLSVVRDNVTDVENQPRGAITHLGVGLTGGVLRGHPLAEERSAAKQADGEKEWFVPL